MTLFNVSLIFETEASTALPKMPNNEIPYYRRFQQIWDPTRIDGRTREACTRCRERRAKCDGQKPCRRCRNVNARDECQYITPKYEEHEERYSKQQMLGVELLQEVTTLQRLMDELEVEIQMRAQITAIPVSLDSEEESNDSLEDAAQELNVQEQFLPEPGKWDITLSKSGISIQTDIRNIHQLSQLLTRIASSLDIRRNPSVFSRPIGTKAMTMKLTVQWPRWHEQQYNTGLMFLEDFSTPHPNVLDIAQDIEQDLLDIILLQVVNCSPSHRRNCCEGFISRTNAKKHQTANYTALRYAVGALEKASSVGGVDYQDRAGNERICKEASVLFFMGQAP
ncbi:hypothetical protein BC936DRAFT_148276 [Jimgerdemannia flammicorona]|uniref:Zn(2)-C6 fungal-type domain-containing protein n=1 Tax=Jimgerdemannia flammicorona TaxID=994334 RepID=A0A433D3C8_9FUNG|nr:hypothetical protein BC936DRAFT_148276 [Jimgerdemannia flammicorona]